MNAPVAFSDTLSDGLMEAVRDAVRLPIGTRIVAAMSGGVDSTVTAALLARAGYDVVGVTLQLYDHGAAVQKKGACCAGQDIHDARTAAEAMGIAHYVLDYESRFREQVIEDFADSYLRGETPIPCIRCNQTVKFRDLLDVARDLGAEAMATGHYVRREVGRAGPGDPAVVGRGLCLARPADRVGWHHGQTARHRLRVRRGGGGVRCGCGPASRFSSSCRAGTTADAGSRQPVRGSRPLAAVPRAGGPGRRRRLPGRLWLAR